MLEPFYVNGTRILGPYDLDKFIASIDKPYLKTIFEMYFWTGMRYVEGQRFHSHREWYMKGRKAIHLPEQAQKKVLRKQLERWINPIPPQLESILPYFFNNKRPPVRTVWNENLKRWAVKAGFDEKGFTPKLTRKTIECWMISAKVSESLVCLRQGHDNVTSLRHYQGNAFTSDEIVEIKKRLSGWIL